MPKSCSNNCQCPFFTSTAKRFYFGSVTTVDLLICDMAGMTSKTYLPGPEPTLELVHGLLEKHDAWDQPFHMFCDLITERVENNQTIVTHWDATKLKTSWDTVQYIRRYYVLKPSKSASGA